MAIVAYQSLSSINGITIDTANTLLIYWGPMNGGDEGQPIQVHAYPRLSWHFTGAAQGGDNANPNIPINADRTFTILGSNDKVCWGPVFPTITGIDASGMNDRINDPLRSSRDDGAYLVLKPKIGGSVNSTSPDCGVLLFCSKLYGPRS